MTLRDGKWRMGDTDPEHYSGTYEIIGNRIVFDWAGTTLTFTFERDADGTWISSRSRRWTPATPWCGPAGRGGASARRCARSPDAASARRPVERQLGGQPRAAPGRALDRERAAERLDPVGQPAQAGAARRVGAADAVVATSTCTAPLVGIASRS